METSIVALAALAHPTRLEVFRLLVTHEPGGLAAGDVVQLMGARQSTMSTHLAVLGRAGLVSGRRFGRSVIYRADLDGFRDLIGFLIEGCCSGQPDLCAALGSLRAPIGKSKDDE